MNSEHPIIHDSMGATTRAIKVLLPGIRAGNPDALKELVTIAYLRLEDLIRGKKQIFAGPAAGRGPRGDEQTGIIMTELYVRLRNAVDNQKLSELTHPAGFWKVAADNVVYILLDMARQRGRLFEDGNAVEEAAESTRQGPEFQLLRQEVLEAVQQLPEPHQTVIKLYFYSGLSQRDIADVHQPAASGLYERKVGRIIDEAKDMLRLKLGHNYL